MILKTILVYTVFLYCICIVTICDSLSLEGVIITFAIAIAGVLACKILVSKEELNKILTLK